MENAEYDKMHQLEKENWWYQARKDLVQKLIRKFVEKPHTLIDVGCGSGMILESFTTIPQKVGVETHPKAVKYTRDKGLTIVSSLNDAPNQADAILMMDVLEHVEGDYQLLEKALSKLSARGKVFITVPAFQWLWSRHDELMHHVRRYSRKELELSIQRAGGKIEYISYWNMAFFIPAVVHKLSTPKNNEVESDLKPVWKPINRLLLTILKIENRISSIIPIPLGTSVYAVVSKQEK